MRELADSLGLFAADDNSDEIHHRRRTTATLDGPQVSELIFFGTGTSSCGIIA